MEWPRRDVAQLEGMEQLANCPLVIAQLVFRFDPALDIHAAPPHKPVLLGIGALQHMRLHRRFLRGRQPQSNPAIALPTCQLAQISRAVILPEGYRSMHLRLPSMKPLPNHKSDKNGITKPSHVIGRLV